MLSKTKAIVLHSIKYGETRLIVDMFTRSHGRLSFIVSLPKTPRGGVRKQYFQPLTILETEVDVRPGAELHRLKSAGLGWTYESVTTEADKLAISLFLAEFLYYALRGEQRNEALYDYIEYSMKWLDGRRGDYANFHLVMLMRMSRLLGFYPNVEDYKEGSYFDLREGVFCEQRPMHRDFLDTNDAGRIRTMLRMDYGNMHLFRMTHKERGRLIEVATLYYRLHLPDFPELRSLDVLREVYGGL